MSEQREHWSARSGFIMAAIGSAVGLGNIWRFPYVSYENGGGAFFIPYLVALITAGFPLLFLDYVVGQKYKGAPPIAYKRMVPSAEGIGWIHVAVCLVIGIFYASVLSWAGSYALFAFSQAWGDDPQAFFFDTYLQNSSTLTTAIAPNLLIGLVVVWILSLTIMYGGIKKGIELANRIFIPLLIVMFAIMVMQAVSLPGAVKGLDSFFSPDWSKMTDPKVWLAAYGHVFFSMSVGFGIMVTYSSYLQKNANLTGSGLVVGFANSSFELVAGIGIFSALGFMATQSGVPVSEVVSGGIGLAFIAFPKIISTMGAAGTLAGVLFFGSLFVAGVTSMVSILQVPSSALQDKFGWSNTKAVSVVGLVSATVSIMLFSTKNAITFVDIIDHFTNNVGIVMSAVLFLVWVSWFNRDLLPKFVRHTNAISSIKLGKAWIGVLTFVTPLLLIVTFVLSLYGLITEGYNTKDYPISLQVMTGWSVVGFFILAGIVMPKIKNKDKE